MTHFARQATLHFVDAEANPLAERVFQGVRQQSIRAVSVGFLPRHVAEEMVDGREFYRLSDNELYEISLCPMGSTMSEPAGAAAI